MHFKNLTFNDLPTVVGELCKRIESLETVLKNSLAVQNKVKENHHVPMTVDEVCTYLGISKSSFYYKVKHGGIPVIKQGNIFLSIVMNWTNGLRPEERYRFH